VRASPSGLRPGETLAAPGQGGVWGNGNAYSFLVPLDSTADVSNTPTSKSVIMRLERAAAPGKE
jgi:hypothetical protein